MHFQYRKSYILNFAVILTLLCGMFGTVSVRAKTDIEGNAKPLGNFLDSDKTFESQNYFSSLPGNLDTTFDNDGKVITDFGSSDDPGQTVALQPDGKIIVAGLSGGNTAEYGFALARYNNDGSLDLTFGINGKVTTFAGNGASAEAVVLQSDGKIVVAGSSIFDGFVLVRYKGNGSLDTNFGTNGVVTTNIAGSNFMDFDYAHSIAIQSDGKIIAAGASYIGDHSDFALARYNSDGSLDTTFDTDGKVTTDFGADEYGFSIAMQVDGKIVMSGNSWNGSSYDFALARYNTNGSLDTSFDGDGKLISDLGNSESVSAVAVQTDGKIVVAGNTNGINRNFVVARYNNNGSLDTTFDGDGQVTTDFGNSNNDDARAIIIQPNGKIIVSGSSGNGISDDIVLARYNTNGALDTTLDGDGKISTAIGNFSSSGNSIAFQSNDKIIVAGSNHNGLNTDFALIRYNTNGSLDTTFYNSGKVTTDFGRGDGYGHGYAVALQSDGKIIVAGSNHNSTSSPNFALARYNGDGSLDVSFGTDGKVTTEFGIRTSNIGYSNYGRAVAIQTNGKIIVAGSSGNSGGESQFALARYNTNGTLDTTFSPTEK